MVSEVTGSVEFLDLLGFLQMAAFNHRDLVLMIDNAAGSGHLTMQDGNVIAATLGEQHGVGALFPLLQGSTVGTFRLLPAPEEMPEQTISLRVDQIVKRVQTALPEEQESRPRCNPEWSISGSAAVLSPEEVMQVFEKSRHAADACFKEAGGSETHLHFAHGGIRKATAPGKAGEDAVYALLAAEVTAFHIQSPAEIPPPQKVLDIASVISEGLRRRAQDQLVQNELSVEHNAHAQEMLDRLAAGELDQTDRLQIARRYLPGGEIAPASVVARLTVDESPEVRAAALETLGDLPEPVIEALANDPDSPEPLLAYFLVKHGSRTTAAAAASNPGTPIAALIENAPHLDLAALSALQERPDLLGQDKDLRDRLRENPNCTFQDLLDRIDKESKPRMRKRKFTEVLPKAEATPDLVLEKPEEDPDKEKASGKLGPRDIQYLAKRGTLRQKMDLVCGNDDDVAAEIVGQPGVPESFILGVAEASAANSSALRHIAGHRSYRRNVNIVKALLFNPKTPVASASGLMSLVRPDVLQKIAGSRDVPDGTRQSAKQLLEKRHKK